MAEPSALLDIGRLFRAGRASYAGIRDAVTHHTAFQQEILRAVILIPLAVWLGDDGVQRAMLVGSVVLVLIVELVNSAIETVVDRIGTEHHELSGRAKDLGSAAVFLSLVNVAVVWGLVLLG